MEVKVFGLHLGDYRIFLRRYNMYLNEVKKHIQASIDTKEKFLKDKTLIDAVLVLSNKCVLALRAGGKIIFCGNGGSFADAQHLSAEFTSRFMFDRPGLASLALGTNNSAITAIGNDYGYEKIFSREIQSIANSEDVLIAITTSGNSKNILEVLKTAKEKKISAFVMTGSNLGDLPEDVNVIQVPSSETPRIQECHILIGHIVCGLVEAEIFPEQRV